LTASASNADLPQSRVAGRPRFRVPAPQNERGDPPADENAAPVEVE
jgi:hypothetical protein